MAADLVCVHCSATDACVALPCMHVACAAHAGDACCGNAPPTIGDVLERLGLAPPGEVDFLKAVPARTMRLESGVLVSEYERGTFVTQQERDGAWVFAVRARALSGWCERGAGRIAMHGELEDDGEGVGCVKGFYVLTDGAECDDAVRELCRARLEEALGAVGRLA